MKSLSLGAVADAVNGSFCGMPDQLNFMINSISIDTRKETAGSLYIPVIGNSFDGHEFIDTAFDKGAVCVLTQKHLEREPYILVSSVKDALLDLAEYYRGLFPIKVVGITGSSGKTTTKDMIAAVLAQKYCVVKTEGNFNNETGLPLTIFNVDETTEILVCEMGMNHFGEISRLSKAARPDICVITNIGVSHIGNLGSREGILKAKSEIFDYMNKQGIAVLNGDDDMLVKLSDREFTKYYCSLKDQRQECFGFDFICKEDRSSEFKIKFRDEIFELKLGYLGEFMVYNAMNAVVTGSILGLDKKQIAKGLQVFKPSGDRMKIMNSVYGGKIINDVYNANPDSMTAALKALDKVQGRCGAVLGDMLELGEESSRLHYETGKKISEYAINLFICIGKEAEHIYKGICKNRNSEVYYFKTKEEFLQQALELLKDCDTVLVKASRAMKFEEIINKLTRC